MSGTPADSAATPPDRGAYRQHPPEGPTRSRCNIAPPWHAVRRPVLLSVKQSYIVWWCLGEVVVQAECERERARG